MKWRAIMLLIAMSGCVPHREDPIPDTFGSLDAWQAHASNQIQAWVPLGTLATNALQIMEQHNFTMYTNYQGCLWYDYRSSGSLSDPVLECINVGLYFRDGKVSGEQVSVGLKGP